MKAKIFLLLLSMFLLQSCLVATGHEGTNDAPVVLNHFALLCEFFVLVSVIPMSIYYRESKDKIATYVGFSFGIALITTLFYSWIPDTPPIGILNKVRLVLLYFASSWILFWISSIVLNPSVSKKIKYFLVIMFRKVIDENEAYNPDASKKKYHN